jgi:hypothetical protein
MEDVAVKIPAAWVRRVNSPLMLVVASLTGVSVSFAPMGLFMLGKAGASLSNPLVWVCFLVIYCVPGFYMSLAGTVLKQLYNRRFTEPDAAPDLADGQHS